MKQFFEAVQGGDLETVAKLLNDDPALLDARNDSGHNAITIAGYNRKRAVIDLLLARGAKLDLYSACIAGDEARVRELIEADPASVSALSMDGWTALHLAGFFGCEGCAKALIAAGAPVNARSTNQMMNMPLHAAAAGRKSGIVMALLEAGADPNARQHGGWTPLHAAAQNNDAAIAHLLIGAGAEVRARADNNQNAMDMAMLKGHQDMVDILDNYGAE